MIVLDTNVLSEPMRRQPFEAVLRWLDAQDRAQVYTTAVTEAEMMAGVTIMPGGKKRDALALQVEQIFSEDFRDRILSFDDAAAREFSKIARYVRGKPVMEPDRQIAAIARARGATLATRNSKDFEGCGLTLINPWTGERR